MPLISRDVLLHLMKLSKLEIPTHEEQFYLDSLNKLMETLDLLQNVVSDSPAQETLSSSSLRLREDIPQPIVHRDSCEKQAPQVLSHFYIVPQVIE